MPWYFPVFLLQLNKHFNVTLALHLSLSTSDDPARKTNRWLYCIGLHKYRNNILVWWYTDDHCLSSILLLSLKKKNKAFNPMDLPILCFILLCAVTFDVLIRFCAYALCPRPDDLNLKLYFQRSRKLKLFFNPISHWFWEKSKGKLIAFCIDIM